MRYLVFLLCFLPTLALAQENDGNFVTRFLENALSGQNRNVSISGFQGALSSRATVQEIVVSDDEGPWLVIREAVLDWNRLAVLRGRIEIDELAATEIEVLRRPGTTTDPDAVIAPEARPFALPELPVSVRIGQLNVPRLHLGTPVFGEEVDVSVAGSVQLVGGEGQATLDIQRIDGQAARFIIDGHYVNETQALRLGLELTEEQGGIISRLLGLPDAPALELVVDGDGTLDDFGADIRLVTDGIERIGGRVILVAEADADGAVTRRFTADVGGDIAPLFAPEYQDFFGPQIALRIDGAREPDGRVVLSDLDLSAQSLILRGDLAIGADGLPERIDITGRISSVDGDSVLLPISPRTEVRAVDLVLALDDVADDGWQMRLQVSGLERNSIAFDQLRVTGQGTIARATAEAGRQVAGTIAYAAVGIDPRDPALSAALGPDIGGEAEFRWQDGDPLQLPRFTLEGADYGISGNAVVEGLDAALRLSGVVQAEAQDISRLSDLADRPLSGAARVDLTGAFSPLSREFDVEMAVLGQDLTFDQPELDNLLAGESRISASARRDETGLELRSLEAIARTLSAQASGRITSAGGEFLADLDFADLAVLGDPYRGRAAANVRLGIDPAGAQTVQLTGTGNGLAIGQPQADALLAGESNILLSAVRDGETIAINLLELSAASLAARIEGVLQSGASALDADVTFTDLSVLGQGFGGSLAVEGRLTESGTARTVQLTGTGTNLAVGQAQANALLRGQTRLELDATEDGGALTLRNLVLENPQINVTASGDAEGSSRRVTIAARLANLALLVPDFPGPLTINGAVTQNGNYAVDLTAQGPGGINARINGTAASDFSAVDLGINGSAQAALANIFIQPRTVTGPLNFNLRVNGPPALSSLAGSVTAQGLRIVDPALGLALEQGTLQANLGGGNVNLQASAVIPAGGQVVLSGPVSLSAPFSSDLNLTLRNARITDPDLYDTTVDGSLRISGPLAGGGTIAGTLQLGETNLQIPSTGGSGSGYIPDPMLHVNEPAAVRATRSRAGLLDEGNGNGNGAGGGGFALNVTVNAPNQIFIRGRGLDAELGGSINLGGTTQDIIPIGQFSLIRGRLDILGQRFTLDEGLARLQGRFTPYIRLVASTVADGVTASIVIEGEANEPDITFTSNPDLPEEEVLARLLFGRGLTNLSPLQAAQLANAVATLAGRGGEGVVGRLRDSFGLDDLDITTDESGETGVRLGRYLSENIYTDVTVGAGGTSEINLNLDVTRSVTVRGRLDNEGETGLGIYYERDY
ncbi:translocation/assembly module TamB domain-containing protein [Halodurantibacterium flavum]|uniref:Translocation/assembly module TamB domain-containing protein n=1 Tax=Halodurantibacterium flavum TaxID=1382802 RepID=A0ABW4S9B7_9RHOB